MVFLIYLFYFILMLVTLGVLVRLFHIIFSRSHLREIRDRSVLRLFESNEVTAPQALPGGTGVPQPLPQNAGGHWDQDQVSRFRNFYYFFSIDLYLISLVTEISLISF